MRIVCRATRYDTVQNARWDSLNYSTVLQETGAIPTLSITAHEQAFVSPHIDDDMLAFHMSYTFNGNASKLSEVRFIDADKRTISMVRAIVSGSAAYTPIEDPAGVARRIAARVMPSSASSHSQGAAEPNNALDLFHLIE